MSSISNFRKDKVDLPIGSVKQVITGNNISNVANTTALFDNGTWIPANTVYAKSAYPELFSQLGNINARVSNLVFFGGEINTTGGFGGIAYGQGLYVSVFDGGVITSTNLLTWSNNQSTNATATITQFVYGNDIYVYSGHSGTIATSTNLAKWTRRTSGTTSNILNLVYGLGNFIYVGAGGVLASSTDAITWTARTSGTTSQIDAIIYNSGLFIYAGVGGVLRTSTNGLTWNAQTSGTTSNIRALTYGNGLYLIGGVGGMLRTSTDGITWTARTSGTIRSIRSIAAGNGTYALSAGDSSFQTAYLTSTDAINWTSAGQLAVTSTIYPGRVIYGGSLFINVYDATLADVGYASSSANLVASSVNGTSFYKKGGYFNEATQALSYAQGVYFFGTNRGRITYLTRSDLVENFLAPTPKFHPLATYAIGQSIPKAYVSSDVSTISKTTIYQDSKFFTIGRYDDIYTSNDGISWTETGQLNKKGIAFIADGSAAGGFSYINGLYIVNTGLSGAYVATSTDLINWNSRSIYTIAISGTNTLSYGNGIFVLVPSNNGYGGGTGSSAILYNSNNISYFDTSYNNLITPNTMFDSTFGNGTHIVVGNAGAVYTSTNAKTWTIRTSGTTSTINAVTYGNSLFAYGTANGGISTSTDGASWTARTSGTTSTILSLTYGNSRFVYGGFGGVLRTSTDGISWNAVTSGTTSTIYSLTYGNGLFVYGGDGGVLASSTDALTWTARTSGTTLRIAALQYGNGVYLFGANTLLRTSTNAIDWATRNTGVVYDHRIQKISYGDGKYLFVANTTSAMSTSTDAITWYPFNTGNLTTASRIIYGNGLYVNGSSVPGASLIRTTTDFNTWEYFTITEGDHGLSNAIMYGNGYYIHSGVSRVVPGETFSRGVLFVSKDVRKWYTVFLDSEFPVTDIAYENGIFTVISSSSNNLYYCDTKVNNPIYTNSWVDLAIGGGGVPDTVNYLNSQYIITRINSIGIGTFLVRTTSNTQTLGFTTGYDSNTNFYVPDFTNQVTLSDENVIGSISQKQLFIKAKM